MWGIKTSRKHNLTENSIIKNPTIRKDSETLKVSDASKECVEGIKNLAAAL